MPKVCIVEGCEAASKTAGMCTRHYTRFNRHGSPYAITKRPPGSTEPCDVDGCDRAKMNAQYCNAHAKRAKANGGDPGPAEIQQKRARVPKNTPCSIDGCERPHKTRGWCQLHYDRWRTRGYVGGPDVERQSSQRQCRIEGCSRIVNARNLCSAHYQRWRLYGNPLASAPTPEHGGVCTLDGCERPHHAYGYCSDHARRWREYGDPTYSPRPDYGDACAVDDCDEPLFSRGYCAKHDARIKRHGDPDTVLRTGYDKTAPAVLYLIRDETRVKIGIATSLEDRIIQHEWHTDVVDTITAPLGEAQRIERWILDALDANGILRGRHAWPTKFDGYTEAWSRDQLNPTSIGDLVAWLSINGDFEETAEMKHSRRNRQFKFAPDAPSIPADSPREEIQ